GQSTKVAASIISRFEVVHELLPDQTGSALAQRCLQRPRAHVASRRWQFVERKVSRLLPLLMVSPLAIEYGGRKNQQTALPRAAFYAFFSEARASTAWRKQLPSI